MQDAIRQDPPDLARAMTLQRAGDLAGALALYRQAVERGSADEITYNRMGNILRDLGSAEESIAAFQQAIRIRPGLALTYSNLGNTYYGLGRLEEAIGAYRAAAALQPGLRVLNNLAAALIDHEKPADAVEICRLILAVHPDHQPAKNNMGVALTNLYRFEDSALVFEGILKDDPRSVEALCNLGTAQIEGGKPELAMASFRRAMALKPGYLEPVVNLGNALRYSGRLAEAADVLRQAIAMDPDNGETHVHYALDLLHQGLYEEGWREYEWRWKVPKLRPRPVAVYEPQWGGEPLQGRTLLLYAEQGLGDVLQFARFAPLIAERGGRVSVAAYKPLLEILKTLPGLDAVLDIAAPLPAFDAYLPMMSAPYALGITAPDAIPARIPYLSPRSGSAEKWRRRLKAVRGTKVGLVWSGEPRPYERRAHLIDRRRSMRLEQFAPLAGMPEVAFVSLQKGINAAQAKCPPPGLALIDWMDEIEDLADTAGLIAGLDLVISVDTSIVHLTGALGKPVWMLSRYDACWRWLAGRENSPWYPTLKIFRQPAPEDWASVMARVAQTLAAHCRV